jgi:predicted nucleic acid-binding protein
MTYLLDTNVVSETSKPAPDSRCIAWLQAKRGQCVLCVITVAEIRSGIERLPNGKRRTAAETAFQFLTEDYAGHFLEFDGASATEWGRYAAALEAAHGSDWWKHFDLRDTQIGAIAREYGLTVATRNVKHFPFCATENPFAE